MNRKDILERASDLINGDRDRQHGDVHETAENMAALLSALLHRKLTGPVTPVEALQAMTMVKVARTMNGQVNEDDYVDMAGYAALAGELATEDRLEHWNFVRRGAL